MALYTTPSHTMQFLGDTSADIALNYPENDYLIVVARALLFVAIVFNTPVLFHPTRESINSIILMACRCCSRAGEEEEEAARDQAEISLKHVNRSACTDGRKRAPSKGVSAWPLCLLGEGW